MQLIISLIGESVDSFLQFGKFGNKQDKNFEHGRNGLRSSRVLFEQEDI